MSLSTEVTVAIILGIPSLIVASLSLLVAFITMRHARWSLVSGGNVELHEYPLHSHPPTYSGSDYQHHQRGLYQNFDRVGLRLSPEIFYNDRDSVVRPRQWLHDRVPAPSELPLR
ncbi:uncharacterized protein CTRU02_208092 [Colletotrichum truncatum]|uniref:Uncharacterized protein n=1 Tax=Colletotrichum truncatum TaxID=5467 RepID=A0ACC3YVB6_COLTU|nr:uncharacterized protein CTRU02_10909 [Colletotrichum truncatum]KAF6786411.1 hypothetical protein CTRU02_10909 [Colletotrichum truncatum]